MSNSNGRRPRKFKLKVSEYTIKPEDREAVLNKHKHIADLRLRAKNIPKTEKDLVNLFKNEIQSVRTDLMENYAHKFFLTTVFLGPHKEENYLPYYPTIDDITYLKDKLTQRLSKDRIEKKKMYKTRKHFNGIEYEMTGGGPQGRYNPGGFGTVPDTGMFEVRMTGGGGGTGYGDRPMATTARTIPVPDIAKVKVEKEPKKFYLPTLKGGGNVFTEPGSMLKLLTGPGYEQRIYKAKKPYDKANYVGVEIELICKASRERLQQAFIDARLAGNVYLKDDQSIQRETEGDQTHEITIISKQPYINDVINRVCAVLNSKDIGSYVNDSCGIHVHIDMRNREYPVCFKNFVNSLPVLIAMVPSGRLQSKYCVPNISDDFQYSKGNQQLDRRQAINPLSYGSHRTVEIRMHSGSTNATKINNWVNILVAIAESKTGVTDPVTTPEDMQRLFGLDSKTVEYIIKRIDKFKNNKALNTKDDHFDQSA